MDTETQITLIAQSTAREIDGIFDRANNHNKPTSLAYIYNTELVRMAFGNAETHNNRAITASVLAEVIDLIGTQVARRFNIPRLNDFEEPENPYESEDSERPELSVRKALATTLISAFRLLNNHLKTVDHENIPTAQALIIGDSVTIISDPFNYEYGSSVKGFTKEKDPKVKVQKKGGEIVELDMNQLAKSQIVSNVELSRRQEYVNTTYSLIGAIIIQLNKVGLL